MIPNIRKATTGDISQIVDFQMNMALETERLELNKDILTAGVTNVLEGEKGASYYMAEIDGTLAGMLMITLEWSDWRNGWVWWIQSVYIRPEFRGKSLYRRLYSYIVTLAEESDDVMGIRLYVDRTNTNAQKVYKSLEMNGDHYLVYEWMKNS
ncbi:MAG: GNAT family N-acetyltransferase [Rikenellaceae bacterium]|nr:GNAT family N-acetyltransferase [Rikenellaceae bacterium]